MAAFHAGAIPNFSPGEVSSEAELDITQLCSLFQQKVDHSRRTGIILTNLGKKLGGGNAKRIPLFGRESRYVFLSTSGINVHGRIQRLCSQLGIEFSSPLHDYILMSGAEAPDVAKSEVVLPAGTGKELDLYGRGSEICEDWERQRIEAGLENIAVRAGIVPAFSEVVPAPAHAQFETAVVGDQGFVTIPTPKFDSQPVSEAPSYIPDGNGSDRWHGMPLSKRRRFSASAEPAHLPHVRTGVATPSSSFPDLPSSPTPLWGAVPAIDGEQNAKDFEDEEDSSSRRTSFDLTYILCHDDIEHARNEARNADNGAAGMSRSPDRTEDAGGARDVDGDYGNHAGDVEENDVEADTAKGKGSKTIWTCDRCGVKIRGKKGNLNRHIANKHDNIRAFACARVNCGRKFQTRLNLVRHEKAVHEGRPHECLKCPRTFKSSDDLDAHMQASHNDPNATLACEVCGSCFGRRSTLNRHMSKVHKTKQEGSA